MSKIVNNDVSKDSPIAEIVFITARTIASLDFISAVQCMILFLYHFVHWVVCHQFGKWNFTDQQEMEQQQQAEADIAREKLDEMETALGDEKRKKEACEHEIQQHLQVRKWTSLRKSDLIHGFQALISRLIQWRSPLPRLVEVEFYSWITYGFHSYSPHKTLVLLVTKKDK